MLHVAFILVHHQVAHSALNVMKMIHFRRIIIKDPALSRTVAYVSHAKTAERHVEIV